MVTKLLSYFAMRLSGSQWLMGHNRQSEGRCARRQGARPYANSKGGGRGKSKTIDAATALGLGVQLQNAMLVSMTGQQGLTQLRSPGSLFGSAGANPLAGVSGSGAGLSAGNSGTDILQTSCSSLDILQLAALLQWRFATAAFFFFCPPACR